MAKKFGQILIGALFLLMIASCAQAGGDLPTLPELEERKPATPGTQVKINWLQYDVFKKSFLTGRDYARDFMIRDFMNDNLAIPDVATAEMIIETYPDPDWTVTCTPVTESSGKVVQISWTEYEEYKERLTDITWNDMIIKFMCDNLAIPDVATAEMIIKTYKVNTWTVP